MSFLLQELKNGRLTLLYGAKDKSHNHALERSSNRVQAEGLSNAVARRTFRERSAHFAQTKGCETQHIYRCAASYCRTSA